MRDLIVITGPTGSGKTSLALGVARQYRDSGRCAEIISADSISLYRGFDIGAAKPTLEERKDIPHHLIDVCDPDQNFTAGDFVREASRAIANIRERNGVAIVVGGTGFYLRSLLQGMVHGDESENKTVVSKVTEALYAQLAREGIHDIFSEMKALDPSLTQTIHPNDHYRVIRALAAMKATGQRWSELNQEANLRTPKYPDAKLFAMEISRTQMIPRIEARTRAMLDQGLVAEVESLLEAQVPLSAKPFRSVGYCECLQYLGKQPQANEHLPIKDIETLYSGIVRSTLKLVKAQNTYLRGQFRRVEWLPGAASRLSELVAAIDAKINSDAD